MGKYIYGIIPRLRSGQVNSNKELFFGPRGITACEEVYTIPYRDISAVASESEAVNFTHLPKDAVARYLIRHQQAIEKVMERFTIIPMRLGTFVCNDDEVRYILAKAYPIVKDIFNKASDKIEVDVAATWSDLNSVFKEIGEEKEIREYKERLSVNPKAITLDDQMKVGVMIKKALDKKREKCALEIQNTLKAVSQDFKAHGLMDDKMIINTAFLIDRAKREYFDKEVEKLNARFKERLNFRCVGPLPPYSFYTLEIKKVNFEEVDWARKRFGLNDIATKEEIKRAHQAKALITHPDRNPDIPGIEKEFNEVMEAYKILDDYCRACEQAGQRKSYSFNEEEFKKNAILVKVRG